MKKNLKWILIVILIVFLFPIPIACGCISMTCTTAPDEEGYIHRVVRVKPLIFVGMEYLTDNCIGLSYFSYDSKEKLND